jgi:hypothetical protein
VFWGLIYLRFNIYGLRFCSRGAALVVSLPVCVCLSLCVNVCGIKLIVVGCVNLFVNGRRIEASEVRQRREND